jgi:hypothetical protein
MKHKRCTKVCGCGRTFRTSAKFGDETKCDACYEARRTALTAGFCRLSSEDRRDVLALLKKFLATKCQVEAQAQEQERIDAAFADIMEGVEI